LNYRLIFSTHLSKDQQPSRAMKILSIAGVLFLTLFCAVMLWFWNV
jgi:hypothetical protein